MMLAIFTSKGHLCSKSNEPDLRSDFFRKTLAEKRKLHYFLQHIVRILLVFPYMLKINFET